MTSRQAKDGRGRDIRVPVATYRLQMNASFRFADALTVVPYLESLGITDLYLSPVFAARTGSMHGYDVIDPTRLNPELGSEDDFFTLAAELRKRDMGLILDIVPNHMAADTENAWWYDVLEKGRGSSFAPFFDIDWTGGADPGLRDKVLLPVLGRPLAEVVENEELTVDAEAEGPCLRYFERRLPLSPESRGAIASEQRLAEMSRIRGAELLALLAAQHYELAYWRDAPGRINYRRFFDISDLVGVRVEEPAVFEATHRLIVRLVRNGHVTGLRVDHVDGLWDPKQYLERLQEATGGVYVVVEKILLGDERLRGDWPVAGTTGYDFLAMATGLLTNADGLERLKQAYGRLTGSESIDAIVHDLKQKGLAALFSGDTRAISNRLARTLDQQAMEEALRELTVALPVYRTYLTGEPADESDQRYVRGALAAAKRTSSVSKKTWTELEQVLLGSRDGQAQASGAAMRWQQLSGAAMAKGLEDSALYIYNPLVSLNDVGSSVDSIEAPVDVDGFHRWSRERLRDWPNAMNATSTHDTKRSEDVRARISVLSEMPAEWVRTSARWRRLNRGHKTRIGRSLAPAVNEEHLFYQVMLGAWPLQPAEEPSAVNRLKQYMVKAAREAGVNTDWVAVNDAYETALTNFVERCCDESLSPDFMADLRDLLGVVAYHGVQKSLAQTLLKVAAPGVPDFYQGSELWDLSLVDPDNRRPVDFDKSRRELEQLSDQSIDELQVGWADGRVKLRVTRQALAFRSAHHELFERGEYIPLQEAGTSRGRVLAFARRLGAEWAIAAVQLSADGLVRAGTRSSAPEAGALVLPGDAPRDWVDVLAERSRESTERDGTQVLEYGMLFQDLPVALLYAANATRS